MIFLPVEAAYEAKRLGAMTAKQNATLNKYKCVMQLFKKLPYMSKLARFVASNFVKSIITSEMPYIVLDAALPKK